MVEFLGTKQLLLVVDNCEHVLDPVADLLDEVSRSCPGVVVLATSREGLALDGERVVPVPSLRGPEVTDDLAVVAGSEAVQLFLERAAAVDPEFVLDATTVQGVVQVCRRLDGVPLAIELAAAQVPMMSPAELGRALDQRFDVLAGGRRGGIERHQTLRATIDWSYEMLDEAQRRLWARLAVFAGGCTRDAVEAVCVGGPVEERAVLALVRDLVARSLVAAERGGNATRYRLLETIRAYGEERIVEHGETDALRDRHAAYYADLARRCGQGLEGPERMEWGARMSADSENMLAAFAHAIDTGNLDLVVMLLESTPPNSPQTGYQLSFPVDSVLSTPGVEHHPGFPLVLMAAAAAANLRGETKIAREYGDAALERERASTARRPYTLDLEAARCFLEGLIASSERSWEDAAVAWLEAAEIYRRGGKLGQAATSLGSAASAFSFGGRFADALPLATEALALLRATSTPTMANVTLMGALAMAVSPQDPTRARALLDEIQGDPAAENYGEATQLTLAAAVIGEWSLAARFATRSIPLLHWVNHRPYLQIVLTLAARILAPTDPESAATIQGAARALIVPVDSASTDERRGESTPGGAEGGVGLLADAARDTTQLLTEALGRERLRELRGRGAALGTDTAVAYTLSRLDVFLTHAG
jgi:predicted ATPase